MVLCGLKLSGKIENYQHYGHLEFQNGTKKNQLQVIWIERYAFQVLKMMKSLTSDKSFWTQITYSGLSIVS